MNIHFENTAIHGLVLVKPGTVHDGRGAFSEIYKRSVFAAAGIKEVFVQENISVSKRGVLRGLHFQRAPFAQAKLVRCVKGLIFDVAVDLRKGSKTFGKWHGLELSGDNRAAFYVPAGFAHGFLSLQDGSEVVYKCSREYAPAYDAGVRWNDPALAINWPSKKVILSPKDSILPFLKDIL